MLAADHILVEQTAVSLATGAPGGAVGRVIDVGEAQSRELVDRIVVVPQLRSCGACLPCRRGHATLCRQPGAKATLERRAEVPGRVAFAIDDSEDAWTFAALADVGLWAYAAVIVASVEPNRGCFVLGEGPLARFVRALVVHRGARALDAAPADLETFGLPVITTGAADAALRMCPDGGTVVVCSAPGSAAVDAITRGVSLHGVLGGHPDLLPELIAFAKKGALDVKSLCRTGDEADDGRALIQRQ